MEHMMENEELKQAEEVLASYDGGRKYCHKIGMIVDVDEAACKGRTLGYDIVKGIKEENSFFLNTSSICTQGLWEGRLPKGMTNMKALACPSMRDYKESGSYWCQLSEEEILQFYEILLHHTPWKDV